MRTVIELSSNQVSHGLRVFLLETYAYFVSVVNITANTDLDYRMVIFDPYTHALSSGRGSEICGGVFGYARGLIELIPSICKLGYRRLSEEKYGEFSFESIALYKSLESQIQKWRAPQSISDDADTNNLVVAAKIYQKALIIFLHTNFYGSKVLEPTLLDLVDASIEALFPLAQSFSTYAPIASTLLWPCMVIGSCLRQSEKREALRRMIISSPFNMTGVLKAVQVLDWLWDDVDLSSYGPYGLGAIMEKHKTRLCLS